MRQCAFLGGYNDEPLWLGLASMLDFVKVGSDCDYDCFFCSRQLPFRDIDISMN